MDILREGDTSVPADIDADVVALGICDCGQPGGKLVQVYLSRRNLLTLLNKLDANVKVPGTSKCTLIKSDNEHPKYPQSHPEIYVTAVEDAEYYTNREPGETKHAPVYH